MNEMIEIKSGFVFMMIMQQNYFTVSKIILMGILTVAQILQNYGLKGHLSLLELNICLLIFQLMTLH